MTKYAVTPAEIRKNLERSKAERAREKKITNDPVLLFNELGVPYSAAGLVVEYVPLV
jgi:hypothetical protein